MSDDPWDDWESAADAGLIDYKAPVKQDKKKTPVDLESENKRIWEEANRYATPIVIRTDSNRTEYKPEIKILKRPATSTPRKQHPGTPASTQPKLSLEERERQYLAAREKIFGDTSKSNNHPTN